MGPPGLVGWSAPSVADALTDPNSPTGATKATYSYTAYGAGRLDPATNNLALGVGTYDPNINGFLSRAALASVSSGAGGQSGPLTWGGALAFAGDFFLNLGWIQQSVHTIFQTNASAGDKAWAAASLVGAVGLDALQFVPVAGWVAKGVEVVRLAKGADAAITAASDAEKLVTAASDAEKTITAADEAVAVAGGSGIPADRPFFPESEQLPYTSTGALHGQMQSGSCLAACARMVLADAGVELPETWIRNAASIDATEGGFLHDLPNAIERLGGPDATYVESGTIADLQRATASGGPVIASVKTSLGRHALIVDAFQESDIGTLVSIRDPLPMGLGTSYQVLMETFTQAWTESFIHFQP